MGAVLLAVPVAVAAAIGFGTSLSGVVGGLSAIANGPSEASTSAQTTPAKLNRAVVALARERASNASGRPASGSITDSGTGTSGGSGGSGGGSGGSGESPGSGSSTTTITAPDVPQLLPSGGGTGGTTDTVNGAVNDVNGVVDGVGDTVNGILGQ